MTDPAPDLAALRERLERHRGVRAYYISVRHDDVFAVLALIDTLQEALSEYGRHQEGCSAAFGYACKCGWTQESGRLLEGDALSVPPAEKETPDA